MQITWSVNWRLRPVVLAWSHFSTIRFDSLERYYSLSKGDMTLEKGLSSQHGKGVRLHSSLGSLTSSKRISYNFCSLVAIGKRPGKFFPNKFFINCIKGYTFSEVIRKKHNLKVYAIHVECKLMPRWAVVLTWSHFSRILFRLSQKRLFALQRRYDSWKGFKFATRQRCSAALFTRSLTSSKRISCNFWKTLSQQVLHKRVDSCAWFLNQNGLNS